MKRPEHDTDDGSGGLQTLAIALELVEELQRANGATVTELQERLGLSKSAIYNHLNTLREYGFVVKDGDRFELSLLFTQLGEFVREQNDLYSVGKEPLEELAEEVGYTAHLVTEEHYNRIEISVVMGEKAVGRKFSSVYDPLDFHTTASGKAILTFVDEDTREAILDKHGLPGRTPNSITDRATLAEELDTIRERGYSVNDEEEMEGLRGVAAPIKGQGGSVEGAVSISAPVGRMPEEQLHDELAEKAIQTANVIQLDLNMASRADT
ncbi:IclR family transcriptional regulator [Halobacteriales archaeon Cl-PHB]